MTHAIDETHSSSLASIVESAEVAATDFPIQNLPLGCFRRSGTVDLPSLGVAIGDAVLDLRGAASTDVFVAEMDKTEGAQLAVIEACREASLNALMGLGRRAHRALRLALSRVLRQGQGEVQRRRALMPHFLARDECKMLLPAAIGDYSDFYASIHHATNVGRMFRPDSPLLPNYKHVPIAYHGRASSIVVSGTGIRRPHGQTKLPDAAEPSFGPSQRLDYECEVAAFIGAGSSLGEPVSIAEADDHLFGLCLLNDWSARDIQLWEYQPLGPFLAKSFATTVSPWVITMDALAPFRVRSASRSPDDPAPLPYLRYEDDARDGAFGIVLQVLLQSRTMREQGIGPVQISSTSFATMYWTFAQMLTHQASNGCNLRPGDMIASGTVSGPHDESRGCLLELTRGGAVPVALPGGENRTFLEDGDAVVIRGWCEREGFRRIGFGECRAVVVAAR
ncbi:MAG: fumarylacetoacetase [Gemmatimonadaceae bacterium]